TAHMYADQVYSLLNSGFSAVAETGETVTVTPQNVTPNKATAGAVKAATTLPQGCVNDGKTDYPGAVDCILDPNTFDCEVVKANAPCTYDEANRPTDFPISYVAIHDIEGTAQDALNVFQDPNSDVSIHYIVGSDGTVYQVLHEKDIAYQIGNYWYNQRSIGIEHAGFDATGFLWYNATEYLASAKLVAYLIEKYHIPFDHDHIVSHGTVPAPTLGTSPNHVDPGPYWLWGYYFGLIHKQGIPYATGTPNQHVITLHPSTDQRPFGANGTETPANFSFFYLYNGPSTQSGLITSASSGGDVTDETYNVEPDMTYFYLAKVKDPAGTGDTMYEIWYGENDQLSANPPSQFEDAHLVWLAVPPGTAIDGQATLVTVNLSGASSAKVYGRPVSSDTYVIGAALNNAVFTSRISVIESGTNILWYQINYNHRQAWVPASEATVVHGNVPA
ncbi:MAG TPA: peptidoglycan recognition family protein, partial [Ktedonobacteraceae bacterium]